MPHSTSQIGKDIQDGGYELRRIPIPRTPLNRRTAKKRHPVVASCAVGATTCTVRGLPVLFRRFGHPLSSGSPSGLVWSEAGAEDAVELVLTLLA
jgi:hypothetical protein